MKNTGRRRGWSEGLQRRLGTGRRGCNGGSVLVTEGLVVGGAAAEAPEGLVVGGAAAGLAGSVLVVEGRLVTNPSIKPIQKLSI